MDYQRDKFEAVMLRTDTDERFYPLLERTHGTGDGYLDLYIQLRWEGWKLALESQGDQQ